VTSAQHNGSGSFGDAGLPPVPSIPLTDESAARTAGEASIGGLVRDVTAHVSTLVRAEVELAKGELAAEVKKALKGSVFFILALTVLAFSAFFFFMALAEVLADTGWFSRGGAYFTVWGLMLLFTLLLAFLGYRKVRRIRAPQRTIESVRDTAAVLRNRGGGEPAGSHADELTAR
jgi:uncharacterized membrane protein YqjE